MVDFAEWYAFPLPCKSWGCVTCSKYLAARWADTVTRCAFTPNAFLTATLDPEKLRSAGILDDYRAQQKYVRIAWQNTIRGLRNATRHLARYVRVYEFHRGRLDAEGRPNHRIHIHALLETTPSHAGGGFAPGLRRHRPELRRYQSRRDRLAQLATHYGFGHQCKAFSLLPNDLTTREYVWKYTTKMPLERRRHRVRMISCDRSIRHESPDFPPPMPLDWFIFKPVLRPDLKTKEARAALLQESLTDRDGWPKPFQHPSELGIARDITDPRRGLIYPEGVPEHLKRFHGRT